MKFEHFALNVPDARAAVIWYVDHLGMRILRQREEPPYTTFLADDTGRVLMELYTNPAAALPDHAAAHPAELPRRVRGAGCPGRSGALSSARSNT